MSVGEVLNFADDKIPSGLDRCLSIAEFVVPKTGVFLRSALLVIGC